MKYSTFVYVDRHYSNKPGKNRYIIIRTEIVVTTLDNRSPTSNPRSVAINHTYNNIIGTRIS